MIRILPSTTTCTTKTIDQRLTFLRSANVTKSENDASDEGKKITSPSDRIATRVRISYDFDREYVSSRPTLLLKH